MWCTTGLTSCLKNQWMKNHLPLKGVESAKEMGRAIKFHDFFSEELHCAKKRKLSCLNVISF
jgi:hypothetical protein